MTDARRAARPSSAGADIAAVAPGVLPAAVADRLRDALVDAARTAGEPPREVTDRILAALRDAPRPGNRPA